MNSLHRLGRRRASDLCIFCPLHVGSKALKRLRERLAGSFNAGMTSPQACQGLIGRMLAIALPKQSTSAQRTMNMKKAQVMLTRVYLPRQEIESLHLHYERVPPTSSYSPALQMRLVTPKWLVLV